MSHRRALSALAAVLGAAIIGGCAHGRRSCSYLPVGACSRYGDRTEDGVTLMLRLDADAAMERVQGALRATGYDVERPAGKRRVVQTAARALGGDTTFVVTAEVLPVELPEPASSVVLTATYSVPSRRLHEAPVIQRPGETSPLYGRLRTIADTLGRSRAPAP